MRRIGSPGSRFAAAVALAVVLGAGAPFAAHAQAGRSATDEGNRLYQEGRFAEAHQKYLEALREAPDSPVIRFNDGNALYQGEDYADALEAFRAAVEAGDPRLLSDAWYNAGNALYRGGQLEESREAYKQALRANPGDSDAKHNLERVLERMQQQEQQQQQGEGQDDQDPASRDQPPQDPQNQQGDGTDESQSPPGDRPEPDDSSGPEQDPGGQDPRQAPDDGEAEPTPPEGAEPQPGQMTREEAERLLDAIQEDQDEVNRKPRTPLRGTRPRKDW